MVALGDANAIVAPEPEEYREINWRSNAGSVHDIMSCGGKLLTGPHVSAVIEEM